MFHAAHAVELVEFAGRSLQFAAVAGAPWVDGLAPCLGVFLVNELRDGDLCEVGVAKEIGAVEHSATEGLRGQMNGGGGTVASAVKVEAFQDVQRLDECNSARGWRRSADDVISLIAAVDRLALLHLVIRKVLQVHQSAVLLEERDQLMRNGAAIEGVRIGRDGGQRACEFGLN